jgi:hypothetical protein
MGIKELVQLGLSLLPGEKEAPPIGNGRVAQITEAMVKAAERDAKIADALQLDPQTYRLLQEDHSADEFLAVMQGVPVEEARKLPGLDEDPDKPSL